MHGWGLVCMLALASCVRTDTSECASGAVCPVGSVCIDATPDVSVCVPPDRARACADAGLAELDRCDDDGRCYAGACVPIACGDALVDPEDEQCDVAALTDGQECSVDCRSDLRCGNLVVDPVKLETCDDGNDLALDGCTRDCALEVPQWIEQRRPSNRFGAMFAYDGRGRRMVMYGGRELADPISDTWQWTALGWDRIFEISAPGPVADAAMAYDAARGQVVLAGGDGGLPFDGFSSITNAAWLWDGNVWTQAKSMPNRMMEHAMAYDSLRQRIVVFGGVEPAGGAAIVRTDRHLEWDGDGWDELELLTVKPEARSGHAMAYDPIRRKIVLFGGTSDGVAQFGDTWEYDPQLGWDRVATTGPPKRTGAKMAFDGTQIVLYGGLSTGNVAETWTWNGVAWTNRQDSSPGPLARHVMAYDPDRGRVVLTGLTGALASSTWEWDGARWRAADDAATVLPRIPVAATFDEATRRVVFVDAGGEAFEQVGAAARSLGAVATANDFTNARIAFDDTRREVVLVTQDPNPTRILRDGVWIEIAGGPAVTTRTALAHDSARGRTVLFSGGETWEWDGGAWQQLAPALSPAPRFDATVAYDPVAQRIVLFGGRQSSDNQALNDTWSWDGTTWTQLDNGTAPPPRFQSSLGWNPSRRVLTLFGGKSTTAVFDDIWEWNGATWTQLTPTGIAPLARFDHHVLPSSDGTGVQVFGGRNGVIGIEDQWLMRWQGAQRFETCRSLDDTDGDAATGCMDADCWSVCDTCGDGIAGPRETCALCPADVPCVLCGNFVCDPGEMASCPGDCP